MPMIDIAANVRCWFFGWDIWLTHCSGWWCWWWWLPLNNKTRHDTTRYGSGWVVLKMMIPVRHCRIMITIDSMYCWHVTVVFWYHSFIHVLGIIHFHLWYFATSSWVPKCHVGLICSSVALRCFSMEGVYPHASTILYCTVGMAWYDIWAIHTKYHLLRRINFCFCGFGSCYAVCQLCLLPCLIHTSNLKIK